MSDEGLVYLRGLKYLRWLALDNRIGYGVMMKLLGKCRVFRQEKRRGKIQKQFEGEWKRVHENVREFRESNKKYRDY